MHRPLLLNRLRSLSIRQVVRVIGRRRFGFTSLISLAAFVSTPGACLAQSVRTIELSPLVAKSTLLSPTAPAKEISVVLVLPLKNQQAATEFAQRVSTPGDELNGKFLTPEEFAAAYGADEGAYAAVKKWAVDNGLKISTESVARTNLTVRGEVSQFEALFNTRINDYRSPKGDTFYSAASEPRVPSAISSRILGAIGLTNSKQKAPLAKVYKQLGENPANNITTDGGTGPGGAFNAEDLRLAYYVPSAIGGTVPETVALFEQGGFLASDVQKYLTANKLPKVPVIARGVNGSGTGVSDPGVELEAVLDIDMIIGINPGVKKVIVYEDGDYNDPFQVSLLDALTAVADENLAHVLSVSYGEDEILQGSTAIQAENQELTQLAAQGITVLVSAGDSGAYGDTGGSLNVSDPGAQPLVTCVGGTSLFTLNRSYYAEEVWNLLADGLGATGGGVSAVWPLPAYQPPAFTPLNGGSVTMRNVPDVTAVGNPATGVAVYTSFYGGWVDVGGTSVSAPIWAGYLSLLNPGRVALGFGKFGLINPVVYTLLASSASFSDSNFYLNDIVSGNNGIFQLYPPLSPGYSAGPFYDNCSGCGSPHEYSDFYLMTIPTKVTGGYPGDFVISTVNPGNTTAAISWTKSKGAMSYLLVITGPIPPFQPSYTVSRGTSTTVTGLKPNTAYNLNVYAVNQVSAHATNASQSFTTTK